MIGAQHIDEFLEVASDLVARIGDVGSEVGVGAVRLDQRPVDVVAELRRAEQRLLAILPILRQFALGRRQAALIDEASGAQILDGAIDFARRMQRLLGDEHLLANVQGGEILANEIHHHRERLLAHDRQPCLFRHVEQRPVVVIGKRLADRLQIVSGIEPGRYFADILAERLAIAQIGRARQHVDLGARIVDVVFARDREAGDAQKLGQRVAEDGTAAMADMQGASRICRDIFDIHLVTRSHARTPVACAPGRGRKPGAWARRKP